MNLQFPFHSVLIKTLTMATSKLVLVFLISLIAYAAAARRYSLSERMQSEAQQCQLQRISTTRPSHRMESEGGATEVWDPMEDQFQCAGVAAMRITIQPNGLSLPKFFPAPRLIYIVEGRGVLGITYAGCPETYHSEQTSSRGQTRTAGGRQESHQKLHRVRRGDIIAVPHGTAHWCYNDGNEDLVAVSVLHLSSDHNQLDNTFRAFMLAGGESRMESRGSERTRGTEGSRRRRSQRVEDTFQNVMRAMDDEILADSFNVPTELVRRMKEGDNRGTIVRCGEEMRMLRPDKEEAEEQHRYGERDNGIEETMCTMNIKMNMETMREADFYTRRAGKINIVNQQKLPILQYLDMSGERGVMMPNAMQSPHSSMTDQRVVYAIRGEMEIQMVDDNGDTVMNERVKEGEMFVIPQFYVMVGRAGSTGFEYVTFKTSSVPMNSPMAGSTSMMRAMPVDVLVNSYQISPSQAEQLKMNRDPQSMLFSPSRMTS